MIPCRTNPAGNTHQSPVSIVIMIHNDTILMNFIRCHRSVSQTKNVVLPGNLRPLVGSPSLYLFFQLIAGLQKLGLQFLKMDVSKFHVIASWIASHIINIIMNVRTANTGTINRIIFIYIYKNDLKKTRRFNI